MNASHLWPSNVWPTPDQWREWFLNLDAPAQYEAAALIIGHAQSAATCTHNHVTRQEADTARETAYRNGWRDGQAEVRMARRATDPYPAPTNGATT